jgi:hypothetical protein
MFDQGWHGESLAEKARLLSHTQASQVHHSRSGEHSLKSPSSSEPVISGPNPLQHSDWSKELIAHRCTDLFEPFAKIAGGLAGSENNWK